MSQERNEEREALLDQLAMIYVEAAVDALLREEDVKVDLEVKDEMSK